jgi:DNA-directed RNA polymerase specialized sigma24 family protein
MRLRPRQRPRRGEGFAQCPDRARWHADKGEKVSEDWGPGLAPRETLTGKRRLAAMLRAGQHPDAASALLSAYGGPLFDFITLMLGPGEVAERVLADTVIAATGLAGWLRDDDLLPAWLFALARCECRAYPPVVWRGREWESLGSPEADDAAGWGQQVPVDVVRMAVLGMGPRDREFLVLSSTRCKLLSDDLAVIFRITGEEAVQAAGQAQEKFERALALSARKIGYTRDPRVRAPEIGEMVGMVLSGIHRPLPVRRIVRLYRAPEMAGYRDHVRSGYALDRFDGFPAADGSPRRDPGARRPGARPRPEPAAVTGRAGQLFRADPAGGHDPRGRHAQPRWHPVRPYGEPAFQPDRHGEQWRSHR